MVQQFENLGIRAKLVIAFLVVAVFAGVLGVVGVSNVQKLKAASDSMFTEIVLPQTGLREITQEFLLNRLSTRALIATTDKDERSDIADTLKDSTSSLEEKMDKYGKSIHGEEELAAFHEFQAAYANYKPLMLQMIDLSLAGKTDQALNIAHGDGSHHANLMLRALNKMAAVSLKHAKETAANDARVAHVALLLSVGLALAAVVVAILIGLYVSGRLSSPLRELQQQVQTVAEGHLNVTLTASCCDEVGMLARSFDQMVKQLRDLIARVSETAGAVNQATRELHGTSEEIAKGAEAAAAQTITVATASEEMAATSHDIANSCQLAVEGAQRANQTAQSGAGVVRQTVEGMRRIAKRVQDTAQTIDSLGARSYQIGAIVATIEDIADQTNLLALNAAIEAARAGEMGRGFAVVADEVRALAERTTKATREIGEMIKAIQTETRSAVKAMDEGVKEVENGTTDAERSGVALEQILSEIDAVSEQVHQIATAAEEQSATTGEITDNIHQMTQVIQDTARGSHETASSASNLSAQAEGLQRLVARFRL